jgi:hypothetical protein
MTGAGQRWARVFAMFLLGCSHPQRSEIADTGLAPMPGCISPTLSPLAVEDASLALPTMSWRFREGEGAVTIEWTLTNATPGTIVLVGRLYGRHEGAVFADFGPSAPPGRRYELWLGGRGVTYLEPGESVVGHAVLHASERARPPVGVPVALRFRVRDGASTRARDLRSDTLPAP